jgi:formylglycine-generating enzyme required for sulfatase activity
MPHSTPREALHVLLCSLFASVDELRIFVGIGPDGHNIITKIGWRSVESAAFEVIGVYETKELIDNDLFERLERLSPKRQAAIAEVAARWCRLALYAEWLVKAPPSFAGLDLVGVGGADLPLDHDVVYVPLRLKSHEQPNDEYGVDVLLERAAPSGHIMILGLPGAGKTTVLRKMLLKSLGNWLARDANKVGPGLPIFVRLRRVTFEDLDRPLRYFVRREFLELIEHEDAKMWFVRVWEYGRIVLLCDGLDEIPQKDLRSGFMEYLQHQLSTAECENVRIVVSSRDAGIDGIMTALGMRYTKFELQPLDQIGVRRLVKQWFKEAHRCLSQTGASLYSLRSAEAQASQLIEALDKPTFGQRFQVMFSNPLLLTLLCGLVQQGREMPRRRVAFYEECLRVLLVRRNEAKGIQLPIDVDTAFSLLRPLAYKLHSDEFSEEISEAELVLFLDERLTELGSPADCVEVADFLYRGAGVLTRYSPGQYRFVHVGIQEYLTALHVASCGEGLLAVISERFDQVGWHEVTRLLVSLPARNIFAPIMRLLLSKGALNAHSSILRECFLEASEVDVSPVVEQIDCSYGDPNRQVALLRLVMERDDAILRTCAQNLLQRTKSRDVRALAEQILSEKRISPVSGAFLFDAAIVVGSDDLNMAQEFAVELTRRGVIIRSANGGEIVPAVDLRVDIIKDTQALIIFVGRASGVFRVEEISIIELFHRKGRKVIGVYTQGAMTNGNGRLHRVHEWIDLRGGWRSDKIGEVCRSLRPASSSSTPIENGAFVEPTTKIRFLGIPGGKFQMGRSDGPANERPAHLVRLGVFWLSETPVTNEQYAVFLKSTKTSREPSYWRNPRFSNPLQPVVGVSWGDAVEFCEWLRGITGMLVSLPTEAQWEYAARGPECRRYPWTTDERDGPTPLRACYKASRVQAPSPVGSFPAGRGPFGALDQLGNVLEWCLDPWEQFAYSARSKPVPFVPLTNFSREAAGKKVLRGGSWQDDEAFLTATYRRGDVATYRLSTIGFRVIVAPPGQQE